MRVTKMTKEVFGEYSAYTTPGGIRFMKAGRLVSEKAVPAEAAKYLRVKLGDEEAKVEPKLPTEPKFPRPSEEELARMREESMKVKPELQMTEEEVEARSEDKVDLSDFDIPEEETHDPEPGERLPNNVDTDFLESVSIYTADLKDIAQALYDRFGIYTVYLGKLPQSDEVNPLTAVPFTKYHLGSAYQAAIYAKQQGLLNQDHEYQRKQIDQSREAHQNFQVDPVPHTLGENRQANSFNFRTSVQGTQSSAATRIEHVRGEDGKLHAVQVPVTNSNGQANLNGVAQRYNSEQEEMIVEPPITGGKPVIRPNW